MDSYIIIPVSLIPEWTKTNVKTYPFCRFSLSRSSIIVDDAHTDDLYLMWLNGDTEQYALIKQNSTYVTIDEFREMEKDPLSDWYIGGDNVES